MTHGDGFPRFLDSVAHSFRCTASLRRTLLAKNLGKPPSRLLMQPVGGRRKTLTMHRIACGFSPARWAA